MTFVAHVYHSLPDPATGRSFFNDRPFTPANFRLVAEVDLDKGTASHPDGLEVAFERTNTIHSPWHENAGVRLVGPPTRSTSVGDIVVLVRDGLPVGVYRVTSAGWKALATN